jgi:hypothetical protein
MITYMIIVVLVVACTFVNCWMFLKWSCAKNQTTPLAIKQIRELSNDLQHSFYKEKIFWLEVFKDWIEKEDPPKEELIQFLQHNINVCESFKAVHDANILLAEENKIK